MQEVNEMLQMVIKNVRTAALNADKSDAMPVISISFQRTLNAKIQNTFL